MNLFIKYCSQTRFPCAGSSAPAVILCLNNPDLVTTGAFLATTICQFYTLDNGCGGSLWQYTFSYDADLLLDDTVPVGTSNITGVFCKDCLTDYFQTQIDDIILLINKDFVYVERTTNYTASPTDELINFTNGPANLTLPTAVGITGKQYVAKSTTLQNIIVVPHGSETIDGQANFFLNQWDSVSIVSTGTNWIVI